MPTMQLTADQRAALEPLADILGGIYGKDAVKLLGGEDDDERHDLIADIVGGAFAADDDEAEDVLESIEPSMSAALLEAGFTGMITDKLGRKRHYVDGKPVKAPGGSAKTAPVAAKANPPARGAEKKQQAHAAARDAIAKIKAGGKSGDAAHELIGHLSKLTVPQLKELQAEHKLKAPGRLKAQIVEHLAHHLGKGTGREEIGAIVKPGSFDSGMAKVEAATKKAVGRSLTQDDVDDLKGHLATMTAKDVKAIANKLGDPRVASKAKTIDNITNKILSRMETVINTSFK